MNIYRLSKIFCADSANWVTSKLNKGSIFLVFFLIISCKQQTLNDGDYLIISASSGKTLGVVEGDLGGNDPVLEHDRTDLATINKIWMFKRFGDANYTIVSKQTGKALTVFQGSPENNSPIEQADLVFSDAQQFKIATAYPNASGLFTLMNQGSGKVISLREGNLEQRPYLLNKSQQWRIEPFLHDTEALLSIYEDCPSSKSDKINYISRDSNFPNKGYINPKNSKGAFTPTAKRHEQGVSALLNALYLGQYHSAYQIATSPDALNLRACKMLDDKKRPLLVYKAVENQTPRSAYINLLWRVQGANNLILESPHSGSDGGVSFASMRIFYYSSAQAMIMNEQDRHSSNIRSGCNGNSGSYGISDVAHAPTSLFHFSHKLLSQLYPTALIANLHGMGKSGNGISISNGLGYSSSVKKDSAIAHFTDIFLQHEAFMSGSRTDFTACQKGTGFTRKQRVCGTTNIQGRHLNGSKNECTERGKIDSDRFLHVEQGAYIRGNQARQKALAEVFDNMVDTWGSPN